jgi:DNA-directed RNA polymerase subunit RPC12/RpoP
MKSRKTHAWHFRRESRKKFSLMILSMISITRVRTMISFSSPKTGIERLKMPSYTCTKCGNKVTYPAGDEPLHKLRRFECANCYTVIHSRRFPKPESGSTVMFGPAGPGIGDYLFKSFLMERFAALYPEIQIMDVVGTAGIASRIGADLIFWADNAGPLNPAPPDAIAYILTNEVQAFVRDGYWPRLWFEPEEFALPRGVDLRNSVVVNLRQIGRCSPKNVTDIEADNLFKICTLLKARVEIDRIILVGNDSPLSMAWLPEFAIDLRGKLTLPEIAWLCKGAMFTIGKDSGILHIAAAAGGYVIGWGYRDSQWRPLAPEGRAIALMEQPGYQYKLAEAVEILVTRRHICMVQYLPKGLPKWASGVF